MDIDTINAALILGTGFIYAICFHIGVRKRFWTPRRLWYFMTLCALPLAFGMVAKAVIEGRGLTRVYGSFLLFFIVMGGSAVASYIFTRLNSREPFRSRYHIKVPESQERGFFKWYKNKRNK